MGFILSCQDVIKKEEKRGYEIYYFVEPNSASKGDKICSVVKDCFVAEVTAVNDNNFSFVIRNQLTYTVIANPDIVDKFKSLLNRIIDWLDSEFYKPQCVYCGAIVEHNKDAHIITIKGTEALHGDHYACDNCFTSEQAIITEVIVQYLFERLQDVTQDLSDNQTVQLLEFLDEFIDFNRNAQCSAIDRCRKNEE